jgi:DNA-binding transcriptional LysR family regulator
LLNQELDAGVGQLRLLELHSFVVLTEELHFARAADRLVITSGGLSRRINHLERALGLPLLHRTTRYVGLTPEGARAVPTVRRMFAEVQALHGRADAV